MKNFFDTLQNIFRKDTTGEGESNKLLFVLRILEALLMVYSLINVIYAWCQNLCTAAGGFFVTFAIYFVFLHMSYRVKTRTQLILINIFAVVSIVVGVLVMGDNTYMQNLMLVLVALDFFAEYGHYKKKAVMSAVLCMIFLYLQQVSSSSLRIPIDDSIIGGFQVVNLIFTFIALSVICYIYSRDSQHLEGKLLEYNKQLKKQASTDALTGLCNRRTAIEFIEELIKEPSQSGFCACMCDIDFFKVVNDSYGHDIGDKVLRGVAEAMIKGFPPSCLISRWGGEEFLVVFPRMNGDDAKMLLDIMRNKIKALEFTAGEKKFGITVTYGLAEYGFDSDADKLVKQADEMLYIGKQNGRDQVVF